MKPPTQSAYGPKEREKEKEEEKTTRGVKKARALGSARIRDRSGLFVKQNEPAEISARLRN